MKKEIYFGTKEEHNQRRQDEFLKLTPGERFEAFLKLCDEVNQYSPFQKTEDKGNFVIEKTNPAT